MRSLRILVVDDYADAATITSELLSILGHTCRYALDAASALTVAEELQPEVAILDIGMPHVSGLELAPRLRQIVRGPLTIAALTGWGQAEDRARSHAAGIDLHVVKPASITKLKNIVAFAEHQLRAAS
ncbi:MAG: response regulator [Deltaproteobacteria bacterium]|nr:response regulator [Deltaproteobacteria bacterium]